MKGRIFRFDPWKSSREVDRALQFIIRTAYNQVPVYSSLWRKEGVDVGKIRTAPDLPMLPIMDKKILLHGDLATRLRRGTNVSRCVRRGTSGMTGSPIDILFSKTEFRFRQVALLHRVMANLGLRRPFRWAEAGAWIPHEKREHPRQRGVLVSILRLPRSLRAEEMIEDLARFNPDLVSGCPSDLQLIAAQMAHGHYSKFNPKLVICQGEILRQDVQELIATAFGCRVADYYNVQEVGNLAWQCPHDPTVMHVNTATTLLEIVDSEGAPVESGIEGEILITNLFNATMPFVRYRLGDRATWINAQAHRCSCGAYTPTLSRIKGRSVDLVMLPDGRRISPRVIDDLVMETLHASLDDPMFLSGVHNYQIIQKSMEHLEVLVEASHQVPILTSAIDDSLRALHPSLEISFEVVGEIPRGETGKVQRVVSDLADRE